MGTAGAGVPPQGLATAPCHLIVPCPPVYPPGGGGPCPGGGDQLLGEQGGGGTAWGRGHNQGGDSSVTCPLYPQLTFGRLGQVVEDKKSITLKDISEVGHLGDMVVTP